MVVVATIKYGVHSADGIEAACEVVSSCDVGWRARNDLGVGGVRYLASLGKPFSPCSWQVEGRRNRDRSFRRKGALVVISCALDVSGEAVDIAFECCVGLAMGEGSVAVCEKTRTGNGCWWFL
jgi:hypothetical protein